MMDWLRFSLSRLFHESQQTKQAIPTAQNRFTVWDFGDLSDI